MVGGSPRRALEHPCVAIPERERERDNKGKYTIQSYLYLYLKIPHPMTSSSSSRVEPLRYQPVKLLPILCDTLCLLFIHTQQFCDLQPGVAVIPPGGFCKHQFLYNGSVWKPADVTNISEMFFIYVVPQTSCFQDSLDVLIGVDETPVLLSSIIIDINMLPSSSNHRPQ